MTNSIVFLYLDPCMTIYPPCLSESDRYSLEALRSIHQIMDDDQDGGIEVEESMEVQTVVFTAYFILVHGCWEAPFT